jgi:hypothetical protein
MFNFLRRCKPQDVYEIREPQHELKLSVRERALNTFSNIEGLDDIKEMMLRALESPERVHTLSQKIVLGLLLYQISFHLLKFIFRYYSLLF